MNHRITGASILIIGSLITAFAHQRPDFSGTWKLDVAKSEFGNLPPLKSRTDIITLNDQSVIDEISFEGPEGKQHYTVRCTTDGQECINQVGSRQVKSKVKWVGSELVITNTLVYNNMDIISVLTWTLSGDGKSLTLNIHQSTPKGETRQKWVFDKQEGGP